MSTTNSALRVVYAGLVHMVNDVMYVGSVMERQFVSIKYYVLRVENVVEVRFVSMINDVLYVTSVAEDQYVNIISNVVIVLNAKEVKFVSIN